jgi:tryptophan-rich sensory protein
MNTESLQKRSRDPADIVYDNDPTQQKYVAKAYQKTSKVAKKPGVPSLIVACALPLVAGILVSMFAAPDQWYKDLNKPMWTPPGPVFGVVWTLIYPIMGLASWLVWADGGFQRNGFALGTYFFQLALNLLWPVLFFKFHSITLAFVDILTLAAAVFTTIGAFQPVNHVAANLMKIYFSWVLFASSLTFAILMKNLHGGQQE